MLLSLEHLATIELYYCCTKEMRYRKTRYLTSYIGSHEYEQRVSAHVIIARIKHQSLTSKCKYKPNQNRANEEPMSDFLETCVTPAFLDEEVVVNSKRNIRVTSNCAKLDKESLCLQVASVPLAPSR